MTQAELKKLVGNDKLVLGNDRVTKLLKQGSISKIFLASNVSGEMKEEIENHAKMAEVEIEVLELTNEDVGVLCKKPFPVAILARKK